MIALVRVVEPCRQGGRPWEEGGVGCPIGGSGEETERVVSPGAQVGNLSGELEGGEPW